MTVSEGRTVLSNVDSPLTTWMPRCARLALADNRFAKNGWEVQHAHNMLGNEKIEPADLLRRIGNDLIAVHHGWLAKRLEALWNSHSHAGSLKAVDWLTETGRLLADLPQDILGYAIDEAVKRAERGFMPNVGQIRAIADPLFIERQTQEQRLTAVMEYRDALARPSLPSNDPVPNVWKPKPGETAAILAEYGLHSVFKESAPPKPIPTVEEYMDVCGISREDAEKIVARQTHAARDQSIGKVLAA